MRWGSIGVVVGLCMVIAVWLRVVAKWGGLVRLRGECSVGCHGVMVGYVWW